MSLEKASKTDGGPVWPRRHHASPEGAAARHDITSEWRSIA